jgi:hypothetical protein
LLFASMVFSMRHPHRFKPELKYKASISRIIRRPQMKSIVAYFYPVIRPFRAFRVIDF